ncbi:ATP-binding protein [Quadrisphaera sp. DSM 44207]|uniref:ATP-binding protein n=1 Tax=Quadrisphaera sp. DSM 44207 TaxID=1881057 RepID=UPI000884692B|nr:ATP-binding protein [Quadrisphaera sp. DSM 44207]SDQ22164.1 Histidine kinase-like ATPase domain-containing protein [Quadrisphaera sp. DSM 44207]
MPVESSRSAAGPAPDPAPAPPGRPALDAGALHLAHGAAAVPTARRALVTSLTAARAQRELVDDAAVVVSELLGNAMRHAEPLGDGGVLLRWRVEARAVRLEVVDGGGAGCGPAPRDAADGATSGRGLRIVDALCSGWGSCTDDAGRHTVWAVLGTQGAVPRSA